MKKKVKRPQKAQPKATPTSEEFSRRKFLGNAAVVAGAAAATVGPEMVSADEGSAKQKRKISIPSEIPNSLKDKLVPASFAGSGMTGAEIFARACRKEGLAALFCAPGNYQIINAIANEGIPSYGGRTEGIMCAAADGFVRVTGEIAAASGTEGPGFTNMIMNIAAANAARTPLLVIASNKSLSGEDSDNGIQQQYQQPITTGMKKFGKRLIAPDRVWEYAAYAFRELKQGVTAPVHLDFPGEITRARYGDEEDDSRRVQSKSKLRYYFDHTKYRTDSRPSPTPKAIEQAVALIQKSERPMIVASIGVFYDHAWDELKQFAEKNDIAVVESGASRGHFSDDHRLSASTGPDAMFSTDLVIFVGQYCMPNIGEYAFSPDAKTIRIHPEAGDIGRNWPIDLGMVSHAKEALAALTEAIPKRRRASWVAELASARKAFSEQNQTYYQMGLKHSKDTGLLHPACIAKGLSDLLYHGDLPPEQTTVVSGGYGIARYTRRWLTALRPGQICNGAYQYGAIGPDIGYAVGAGAAVQQGVGPQAPYKGSPVIAVTGDAGAAYSIMEMETLAKYRIPAIVIVYNNNAWGVWRSGTSNPRRRIARAQHMYLFQENLRYDKIAESLGGHGAYVTTPQDFEAALKESYELASNSGVPSLINCQAKKEFWDNSYPPGMLQKIEPGCMSYYH